jgi:hypothetical protein
MWTLTPYCASAGAAVVLVVLELTVLPFLVLDGLTASLSTAVRAMKDAQAARAKKMFWLDTPVSAGKGERGGEVTTGAQESSVRCV